jgi:hypothetical protein
VNCRIFAQKEPDSATRLVFGRDSNRPEELRVEWEPEDWIEVRPGIDAGDDQESRDALRKLLDNPMSDPVAYPMLGAKDNNEWEIPL